MKTHSYSIRRDVGRALVTLLGLGLISASASAGDIIGQITDPLGQSALSGASVTVAETGASATTDPAGRFRFVDLAAGNYTLNVRYIGYDPRSATVDVPASGAESVSISLGSEVVQMEGLVVEGFRAGRSRALQQKENQTNISDIVSADALGNLPDRNVAEGIARLPGVSLSLDQGEGRYVSIRGAEPGLNQVLLDGATMAAPGGRRLGRAVPLDTLSAGQIASVEVIKSVTPDLDANSIGGTVNIKSVSAFDREEGFFAGSFGGNYNESADAYNPEVQATYTTRFGADRTFGLAASASFEKRDYENNAIIASWSPVSYGGATVYVPKEFQINPERGNTERSGVNLNLEYRPDADTQFFFRPNFSVTNRFEDRYENIYSTSTSATNLALTSPTTGTFTGGSRTERRNFRIQQDQTLLNLAAGMKKTLGNVTIEPMATFSSAKEDRVYFNVFQFRNSTGQTGPINFDVTSFVPDKWDVDLTTDTADKYELRRVRFDDGPLNEDTFTAKTDVTWDLAEAWGRSGSLKSGVKFIDRDRKVDLTSYRLVPVGKWTLDAVGFDPAQSGYDGRYTTGPLLNYGRIDNYVAANPSQTTYDAGGSASNSVEDDYDLHEKIYAAYAMGTVTFDRLDILGGVRWERTESEIAAVQARNVDGNDLGYLPLSGSASYDQVLPNLQGVYHFTDTVLLRAAFTETIGRPAYEDASPLSSLDYEKLDSPLDPAYANAGSLEIGNPELGPYESLNFDLSLEWYVRGDGLLSVAWFRKEIDNPIYSYAETQRNVTYDGIAFESLGMSSVRNADSATVSGVELSIYQPFRFLPSPLDGFGIDANLTFIDSSVTVAARPNDDLPFFRQPDQISNVTLFYEKYGFSARIAWNRVSDQLDSLGSAVLDDIYRLAREQYDFQASYRLSEHYSLTASVRNLTEEPEEYSYGIKNLVNTSILLGRDYRLGVNLNF